MTWGHPWEFSCSGRRNEGEGWEWLVPALGSGLMGQGDGAGSTRGCLGFQGAWQCHLCPPCGGLHAARRLICRWGPPERGRER